MVASGHIRGHKMWWDGDQWAYADTGEPTADGWQDRPCGVCDEHYTDEGHDPCLGTLPGVMSACCGHGSTEMAYVQYPDGSSVRGEDALRAFDRLKAARKGDA